MKNLHAFQPARGSLKLFAIDYIVLVAAAQFRILEQVQKLTVFLVSLEEVSGKKVVSDRQRLLMLVMDELRRRSDLGEVDGHRVVKKPDGLVD